MESQVSEPEGICVEGVRQREGNVLAILNSMQREHPFALLPEGFRFEGPGECSSQKHRNRRNCFSVRLAHKAIQSNIWIFSV